MDYLSIDVCISERKRYASQLRNRVAMSWAFSQGLAQKACRSVVFFETPHKLGSDSPMWLFVDG